MSDQPFDRTIINPRERPLSGDVNQLQSTLDRSLRHFMGALHGQAREGFVGESFQLAATGPATAQVVLAPGLAYQRDPTSVPSAIGGLQGVDDRSIVKPIVLVDPVSIAVPAPPGSNSRIDLVEVRYVRRVGDPAPRDIFDPLVGRFDPGTVSKTLSFALSALDLTYNGAGAINYKTGTPAGSPVAPTPTTGYLAVGTVLVASGTSSYGQETISDFRQLLFPAGGALATLDCTWIAAGTAPTIAQHSAPPGVAMHAVGEAGGSSLLTVYLLGKFATAVPQAQLVFPAGGVVTLGTPVVTTLNSTDVSHIGDAAKNGFGAQPACAGAPCVRAVFSLIASNGGLFNIFVTTDTRASVVIGLS